VRTLSILGSSLLLLAGCAALAQEGHPLTGTWHGEWSPAPNQQNHLVLFMKYDGKQVNGSINPGPRAIPLKTVTLDPTKWTVHLEGDGKDKNGNPVHVVADGKIDDLGSYNRTISGTWMEGNAKGEFKIRRD
jgi:hypothetical protein